VRAAVAQLAQVRGGTVVISPPEALAEFSGETSTPVFDPRHGRLSVQVAGPGVFRQAEMEAALSKSFKADAIAGIAVKPRGLNSDLHGSAAYRAHLISVMAKRALAAAK
jgi:CO/xanthine dehydrogenase FAD-binding subunit